MKSSNLQLDINTCVRKAIRLGNYNYFSTQPGVHRFYEKEGARRFTLRDVDGTVDRASTLFRGYSDDECREIADAIFNED